MTDQQLPSTPEELSSDQIAQSVAVLQYLTQNKDALQNDPRFSEFKISLGKFLSRNFKNNKVRNASKKIQKEIILNHCQMKQQKIDEKIQLQTQIAKIEEFSNRKIIQSHNQNYFSNYLLPQMRIIKDEQLETINQDVYYNEQISKRCYICKLKYHSLHFFYDQMCPPCAQLNYQKRSQKCNLANKVALVTGGRIKIGYQIVLILLRNGAFTIITTRFPKDAALRFQKEADFNQWSHRMHIYGVDFRISGSVYEFCNFIKQKYSRLDILINNAAQTIQKKPETYDFLIQQEFNQASQMDENFQKILPGDFQNQSIDKILNYKQLTMLQDDKFNISKSSLLQMKDQSQLSSVTPLITDSNNEVIQIENKNSWVLKLDEVNFNEFLEVQAINSFAPFILCSQLKETMRNSPEKPRFIINVSAMEGQFYRFKSSDHPHTNMAKASLNMMTRTVGGYYSTFDIYMNSVDTGWVTLENPGNYQSQLTAPLDEIDGAMRVLDCVFLGYNENKLPHSKFFKDYTETFW